MKQLRNRWLSALLMVTVFITSIPATSLATDDNEDVTTGVSEMTSEHVANEDTAVQEPYVLYELEEKRTANEKHFLMSDGSVMAASYELPIHFMDAFGKWKEYDNTPEETADGLELTNKESDKAITFSKKARQNKMIELQTDGYPISWGYEKIANVPALVTEPEVETDVTVLKNVVREVRYENCYPGVDIVYYVHPEGIKENLLLQNRDAKSTFIVNYKTGKLKAEQTDGQTIELKDGNGNVLYTISAPEMSDAEGNVSEDVYLEIIKTTGTGINVCISADTSWLQEEGRTYPVCMDPLVTVHGQRDFTLDCYVVKKKDGSFVNMNNCRDNYVGNTGDGVNRLFQKLSLPELTAGDVVTKAVMQLAYVQYQGDNMGMGDYKIDAYEITEWWDVNNISFYQGCDSKVLDYCMVQDTAAWYSWDITKAVKHWYAGGNNYGIMLRGSNENGIVGRRFYGNKIRDDSTYAGYRPVLQMYYINTTGLNDYNSYKTIEYGTYGTLHINEYRGSITYTFSDVSYGGNLLNANIYHVYDSDTRTESGAYGTGWRLNISEKISSVTGNATYPFKLRDEDGTEIYFKTTDVSEQYEDEVGRGWILKSLDNAATPFLLTDKEGNQKTYDSDGYLLSVEDSNGNILTIGYTDGKITSVTDSGGRVTNLSYSNGLLDTVTDPAGRTTRYQYSEDGYLTGITRYNGENITIHYWNGRLDIVYMNTSKIAFGYTGEKFAFLGEGIVGQDYVQKLRAEYTGDEKTVFTHPGKSENIDGEDRILEHCVFNAWGQKISSYITDKDGKFLGKIGSNTFTANSTTSGRQNNKLLETYATNSVANEAADSSFEKESSWQPIYWATSNPVSYFGTETNTANAYMGQKSGRISATTPMDATVSFYQYVYHLSGGTYTLSGYVKTENLTGPLGAYLCGTIYYTDGRAAEDYFSEHVLGTTDREVENGFRRISVTFTVPESDVRMLQLHAGVRYGSVGTAWFDCIQLEEGELYHSYNLIENGGMESGVGWNFNELTTNDAYSQSQKIGGNRSFLIQGEYGRNKNIYQYVDIYGKAEDVYILSAWAKADSVATDAVKRFYISPLVIYTDGSTRWLPDLEFDAHNSEWQYASKAYSLKDGEKQPKTLGIFVCYYYNQNTCCYDNIQLVKDNTQSYVYDSDGNLKNAVTVAEEKASYEYADNEVVKSVSPTGNRYYGTYDVNNKHLLTASYGDGISYQYSHDSKGNVTKVRAVSSEIKDGGIYVFRSAFGDYAVDAQGGSTADGTQMISYKWNQTVNQKFRLEQVGTTGYYTIHSTVAPEMVLTVKDAGTTVGTKVILSENQNLACQQFRFHFNSNGTYRVVPKHDETLCWDTWEMNGAHLEVWSNVEGESKSFVPERLDITEDTLYMESSATYTTSGQYLSSLTDTLGNTISYLYDELKDELKSQTDAMGNRTVYENTYGESNVSLVYADADKDGVQDEAENYVRYTTQNALLQSIVTNNNQYTFVYDAFGNRVQNSVGGCILSEYTYQENNGKLTKTTYGNGHEVRYEYDHLNRVSEVWKESPGFEQVFTYRYDKDGNVRSLYEGTTDITTTYTYDSIGRLVLATSTNGFSKYLNYDAFNRVNKVTYGKGNATHTYQYIYNFAQQVEQVLLPNGKTVSASYDGFNRLTGKSIDTVTPITTSYMYVTDENGRTSTLVESMITVQGTHHYTYDANGNITEYRLNGNVIERYTYDNLNQLKTVTRGSDVYEYFYDKGGNILEVRQNGESIKTYGYGDSEWKDKLTSYNGQSITYDAIGNPLQYRNNITFSWKHGRNLASAATEVYNLTYTYNADGKRAEKQKTNRETGQIETHYYEYNGDILINERWGEEELWYLHDESGSYIGFTYNGTTYYYVKNLQGDVTGIADEEGNLIAAYTYNEWGKVVSITGSHAETIGQLNPIRYRGYYYDAETGFYYVSSRYYDPEVGRFISADTTDILGVSDNLYDKNLYAYCDNNPIIRKDATGAVWETVFDIVSLGFSIAEVAKNPRDAGAWVGLIGDAIDLVPFVTGVGEVAKTVRAAKKIGTAIDTAKTTGKLGEVGEIVIKYGDEVKIPNQIRVNDTVDAWDAFLGPNQTNYNRFTGKYEIDRIFSADGTKSIRFGGHEMRSIGTPKAHFHYERWVYLPMSNSVYVKNILQRIK